MTVQDTRTHSIYTVWAAMNEDLSAAWMIWACDEYSYEADPDVRDAELAAAKRLVCGGNDESGYAFREVTIKVDYGAVQERFDSGETEGLVAA